MLAKFASAPLFATGITMIPFDFWVICTLGVGRPSKAVPLGGAMYKDMRGACFARRDSHKPSQLFVS